MAANLETVIKQLSESSIISQGKLENFVPPKAHPTTAEELVAELVKQNHLTSFQAQHVKAGKAKALILGNYTILEMIGAGGMGQVFKAEHRRMERIVAIKMLPPAMTKNATALARFQREVKAAARLRHSNIVGADDADEANGSHFLVMEYIEGRDLSAHVKKNGPFSVDKAVNYTLQAARGLEFAHAEGVVHRDIKPANLLLDKKGVVKILDMGLARIDVAPGDVAAQAELTGTGAVMGTVDYMAPEQGVSTHGVDARADIYSLGCTLHYLLLSKPVYEGETIGAKFLAHHRQPIPDLSALREDVPGEVNAIFQKMVAKQPEDRYQTMTEVIADFQACGAGRDESLTMPQTIASSFDNRTLQSLRSGALTSKRGAKKKVGGDKKKLIYVAAGAAGLGVIVLLTVVVLLRGKNDKPVAETNPPATAVLVSKVEPPVAQPSEPQASPTPMAQTPVAKTEPPVMKTSPPATTIEPTKPAPASVAKAEPPVTKPTVMKPAPPTTPAKKTPAPIVVAKIEPPIAKPTANDTNATTPPATKAPAPAPAAKVEPVVMKDARLPIPDEAAQKRAEKLMQELFKADLAQAKLPEQKLALAEKILAQADITRDDSASKYAMLQEARRLAIDVADAAMLDKVIKSLSTSYEVDAAETWIESLEKAGQKPRLPPVNKSLVEAALGPMDELVASDQFDLATRLQSAVLTVARKARDPALQKDVVDRGKTLSSAKKQWEAAEKTSKALAADPDDATANLAMGKYLCFSKGAWLQGFAHLAKGSDPTLAELAVRSQGKFSDPMVKVALADAWWTAAESAKGPGKVDFQIGGGYWYAMALSELTGLEKSRVEQRIQALPAKTAKALLELSDEIWRKEIAALPAEKQLEVVSKKLEALNPGFTPGITFKIEGGVVTEFIVDGRFVTDISPVRALPGLKLFRCTDGKLSDISPLRGMKLDSLSLRGCYDLQDLSPLVGTKLSTLDLQSTKVGDLSPLRGMPLNQLSMYSCKSLRDISPLRGMKLTYLSLRLCPVSDLEPLRGMPLTFFSAGGPQIQDFSPLRGMKLTKLEISSSTQLKDLELLQGMKLTSLSIDGIGATDLTPLRNLPLDYISLTPKNIVTGMDVLRNMKSLRTITVGGKGSWPAAEFWTRYDRGEFR